MYGTVPAMLFAVGGAPLDAAVTGAAPSQLRLFEIGVVPDPRCQLCYEEVGDYMHRHFRCPSTWFAMTHFGLAPGLLRWGGRFNYLSGRDGHAAAWPNRRSPCRPPPPAAPACTPAAA